MNHLAEGTLRRAVDEPFAISDDDRDHLVGCERCRHAMQAVRADRDAVFAAMSTAATSTAATSTAGAGDVETAWGRLAARVEAAATVAAPVPDQVPRRRRLSLRRPAVAVSVAALVVVGTTAAAAAVNWLPIFHPDAVSPVTFQLKDLTALPDLTAYGALSLPATWQPEVVADAAAAQARTGIAVPAVGDLPTGVSGRPRYAVLPASTARFTFSAAKARAAAAAQGQTLPPMPAGIDGSELRLDVGPAVVETWVQGGDVPTLTVVSMTAPTASSQGVPLSTLESYLLAQPGIPAAVAAQLRALPVNGSVLPIPVPSDYATSSSTTVAGVPATEVKLRNQAGAALIWIRAGRLSAVFGLLSPADLHAVADGLG